MYKYFIFLVLLFTTLSAEHYNKPAFILAAGNLKFVFPQMIKVFYKKYPNASVHIQYAASGTLANSILQGKEYDIFFSANITYAKKVYAAKKSVTSPKNYAQGLLILFVPSHVSLSKEGINILNDKNIKYITLANKLSAPYGKAAMEAMTNSKCSKKTLEKIHYSSDVATAIDNVIWYKDAGFLSKSALCMIPNDRKVEGVNWIEVDTKLYSPIIQAYVISKDGQKNDNAQKFLHFIESKDGQKIFYMNGYKNIYHK
jgi:molybdate transport system substrate-binding protein